MYGDDPDPVPSNTPIPLGSEFMMMAYVNASSSGCKVTRRSSTGFIVFLNSAPIFWFSKNQRSCETSTFGSECVAMKQYCEYIRGLRYKLRMMGNQVKTLCLHTRIIRMCYGTRKFLILHLRRNQEP